MPILGTPMIIRTYQQALKAKTLDAVVVATDDERIAEVCRAAGAAVVMTSPDCPNGEANMRFIFPTCSPCTVQLCWIQQLVSRQEPTDLPAAIEAPLAMLTHHAAPFIISIAGSTRCHEAVCKTGKQYDLVINIQGDEPLIDPEVIDAVVTALQDSPDAVYRWGPGTRWDTAACVVCRSCSAANVADQGGDRLLQGSRAVVAMFPVWVLCVCCSTACTPLAKEEVPLRQRVKCVVDKVSPPSPLPTPWTCQAIFHHFCHCTNGCLMPPAPSTALSTHFDLPLTLTLPPTTPPYMPCSMATPSTSPGAFSPTTKTAPLPPSPSPSTTSPTSSTSASSATTAPFWPNTVKCPPPRSW